MDIKEILTRRSDLGTFIVHLTRQDPTTGLSAKDNLKSILGERCLEARNPYGSAVHRLLHYRASATDFNTQKVACFTETPLQYLHLLIEDIEGRSIKYEPYGFAITRRLARKTGINPVWYLDITQGHTWLTNYLNTIIDNEIRQESFKTSDIAQLTPYIEQMGMGAGKNEGETYFKEYWWEREWRYRGDYGLPFRFIVICPEEEKEEIFNSSDTDNSYLPFIDASWSLEQIIARLARLIAEEVDPF